MYESLIASGIKKENILLDEPMSKYTSFKAGGKAKYFIKVYNLEEIKQVIKISKEFKTPIFILGNGTNILVKDSGFNGIIMQIKTDQIKIEEETVTVDSGVKNAQLASILTQNSLTGFEFASRNTRNHRGSNKNECRCLW